jgi:hypothetical protein
VAALPLLPALQRLIAGESPAEDWIRRRGWRGLARPIVVLTMASALYGAAMGAWRDPQLALYVAVKAPVLLLAVATVNALVNGAFAARFGVELLFGETLRAVLLAFLLASLVLAALAPVFLWFALTLENQNDLAGRRAHDVLGIAHIAVIAFAGTLATLRQMRWIADLGAARSTSRALVVMWLATNLLAGAQISWILRPWFGTPSLEVAFLRAHPFDGTFYESFLHMLLPS